MPLLEPALRQAAALADVPGLPADALLCVRRVHARIDREGLRHVGGLLGAADQLSRQLQKHAGEARRPAREFVPENAAAVRFDNRAEMLACAARDWLDGQFSRHWWWRSLLGGTEAQGVVALWRRHPDHARAALAQLADRAEEFRQRLPAPDAAAIADLLDEPPARRARPIESPEPVVDPLHRHEPASMQSPAEAGALPTPRDEASYAAYAASVADGAPNANDSASPGITKKRPDPNPAPQHPTEVESAVFDRERVAKKRRARGRSPAAGSIDTSLRAHDKTGVAASETPRVARQADMVQQGAIAANPASDCHRPQQTLPSERKASLAKPDITAASAPADGVTPSSDPIASRTSFAPSVITGETIETAYGGVLYLLNAALHLGLYPEFARPQDPGIALSPWVFLALCGERLAGRGLRRDALWQLLATLAQADPSAFADAETAAPPSLPVALQNYLRGQDRNASSPAATWRVWFDQLLPPLRRRLAAALGVSPRKAGQLLCRQRATILYRRQRLDAHFSLTDHPIAIRLAGLDRDPGWLPSTGYDVRFFYDHNG